MPFNEHNSEDTLLVMMTTMTRTSQRDAMTRTMTTRCHQRASAVDDDEAEDGAKQQGRLPSLRNPHNKYDSEGEDVTRTLMVIRSVTCPTQPPSSARPLSGPRNDIPTLLYCTFDEIWFFEQYKAEKQRKAQEQFENLRPSGWTRIY